MMAKRLGVATLGVVETMSDETPKGAKEVADTMKCELLGIIKHDKKFSDMSDRGIVPVEEDPEIREEFIRIVKKITA